jgi:hypothetical protein
MSQFTKDEPVLALSAAGSIVGYLLEALKAHGIIGDSVASSLSQQLVPIVAAALVLVAGVLVRHFVTPYAKVKALMEKSGLLSDADFGRIEALLLDAVTPHLNPQIIVNQALTPGDVGTTAPVTP